MTFAIHFLCKQAKYTYNPKPVVGARLQSRFGQALGSNEWASHQTAMPDGHPTKRDQGGVRGQRDHPSDLRALPHQPRPEAMPRMRAFLKYLPQTASRDVQFAP